MKKYVVITGGAGFIGSNLIQLLLKKTKLNLISIDNYSSGTKENHINNKRIKYLKSHTKEINKILKEYEKKIKVIFHFGEFSRITQSFKDNRKCFISNIIGSYEVINYCLKNKIKIIYSATSASLGNNENDRHLSPYAFSKSTNMNLILNLEKWVGLKYEIIYFYNVYGPKQLTNSKMSAVVGIFEDCYKKNKPIPVVLPGTQTRRFTHVKDTVETCLMAWKKNNNAHYAVVNKKSYSIIELAKLFSNKIKLMPARPGERFESKILGSIRGRKINNIFTKDRIKNYVYEFKKG